MGQNKNKKGQISKTRRVGESGAPRAFVTQRSARNSKTGEFITHDLKRGSITSTDSEKKQKAKIRILKKPAYKEFSFYIYKEEEYFVAQCLNVEVSSFGLTKNEAKQNIQEAVELYLEENENPNFINIIEIEEGKANV